MPGKTSSWARHCTKCLACAGNLQGCWPRMSFHWGRPCHGLWPGVLGPSFNPNDNPLREVLATCSLLKGYWVTERVRSWPKWWSWDRSPALTRPVSLLLHEYSKLLLFPAYSFLHLEYSSSRYSHDSLRSLFSFPVGLSLDKQSNVAALMQPLSTFATLSSPQYLSPFNTLCIHLFNVYYLPSQECKLLKGGNWYLLSSLLYTYSACIEHALIQF